MEEIKAPKKERKFLKAVGNIAKVLANELVMGIARKFIGKAINKVGNKRQGLVIAFLLVAGISYASIDSIPYPITGNKQRLGFQTTGNGLVWRGLVSDTVTKPTSYADKNVKAYLVLDSVTGSIYVWKQGAWASLVGGGSFTQPVDSLFFDTSVSPNNVDTAKMRWDYELGTIVLGMYDKVPNEIGFKNFWLVKNQTGSTITKGSLVYANGTVGASGRITVAKFIANGTIDAKLLLGITAHDLTNGEDGYVISFGKIRKVNTDTFAAGAILYPSPTVAGVWTDVEPVAPNIDLPIGFCINSHVNNGTISIRVASGYALHELHDVAITSPSTNASLYYKSGLWRDTTAALLVSDTASMLANYATKAYADTSGRFYARQDFTNVSSSTLTWTQSDTLVVGGTGVVQVYRNGQILLPTQYTIPTNASVIIGATAYKVGENYTVIFPKGGGGSGGGGTSFDTTTLNLQSRFDLKLNISDTAAMLANYATKNYIDTSGRFYARQDFRNVSSSTLTWTQTDTLVVNDTTSLQVYRNGQILLPSQYTVPTNASVVIGSTAYKVGENYTVILPRGGGGGGSGSGSLTSISGGTGITVSPNPITTTGTVSADLTVLMELTDTTLLDLTTRFATKQNNITLTTTGTSGAATLTGATLNIPQYSGGGTGTVTSVGSGYGLLGGPITTTGTLRVDTSTVYDFVRDSIVAVEIGGDTIKIIKQEYVNVTSDTLVFTILPKFPIQLRQFILLFRNGQLLLNDQFSVIDTNKVKVASTSYKLGENYTLVTVSGIGSVSSGQSNPIYPEAGIALSTGTTWTTSITNNSSNWNTAFTDRLKWDGGSTGLVASTGRTSLGGTTVGQSMFTLTNPSAITFPQFNDNNTVSALSAASFRSAIGAGTVTSVTVSATSGNPLSIANNTTTPTIELLSATTGRNGYLTSTDWNTFNNKFSFSDTTSLNLTTRFASKQNNLTLTTTGTSGAATLVGATLNIPQYSGGGGGTGTVTSVGLTAPSIFTVSGSPVTTSGTLALTYSGNALPLANGGTGATTADAALTNLGVTTVGKALLVADNSVSDKFIKINADKTITLLNAADTRTAIGAGTVTSVSGTGAISVATGTTTPVISVADAAFGIAGIVTSTGTQQFSGDKTFEGITQFNGRALFKDYTYTATRLAGLSSTDRFATVTIGTGLSLASGTLSATGGSGTVTSVSAGSPANGLSVATGTTTPVISMALAASGTIGVVSATTQTFSGNKTFSGTIDVSSTGTFGGRVNTPWLERTYTSSTATTLTVSVNTTWLNIHQDATVTLTLPSAATYPGKELIIKQTGTGNVLSASSNIIGFTTAFSGSTQTSIIAPATYRFATLVSDGTYWVIMQRNN